MLTNFLMSERVIDTAGANDPRMEEIRKEESGGAFLAERRAGKFRVPRIIPVLNGYRRSASQIFRLTSSSFRSSEWLAIPVDAGFAFSEDVVGGNGPFWTSSAVDFFEDPTVGFLRVIGFFKKEILFRPVSEMDFYPRLEINESRDDFDSGFAFLQFGVGLGEKAITPRTFFVPSSGDVLEKTEKGGRTFFKHVLDDFFPRKHYDFHDVFDRNGKAYLVPRTFVVDEARNRYGVLLHGWVG